MQFELDENQQLKINAWQVELDSALLNEGKTTETGAIGGRFTYSFTPTSLGTIVKVHDELTKQELDLTDYDCW
jgi:hypothetical protein